jgi:threonine dehydratase
MASKLKCPLTVYVPTNASKAKVDKVKNLGANIAEFGDDCCLTEIHAREQSEKQGIEFISPYNDLDVVKG